MGKANVGSCRGAAVAAMAVVVLLSTGMAPLLAQHRSQWKHVHDDRELTVTMQGEIELSDDERAVTRLSPGGRLQVEESRRGEPSRMVIVSAPTSDALEHVYIVNGRARSWDHDGRAWFARLLPEIARESSLGAEHRVRRIHASRGAPGVLDEIERIRSSSSKRTHLTELFRLGPLSPGEAERALGVVAGVSSSSERAKLAILLAGQLELRQQRVRAAFFDAVDGISSSSEKRRVLVHVLRNHGSDVGVVRSAIRSARQISSSSEKAAVLLEVPLMHLRDSATVRTYRDTLDTISSGSERERAMTHLLAAQG